MGLRIKALLIGMLLVYYSPFAAALGLGEIKLNSALNQPLVAEIELLHVRDLNEREILINLATPEDFERAGVDRAYFLANLKFQVDFNASGGPVVRVTSTETVQEPFLNFILSAQWPSGKLLREYTLLVDLPVFSNARPEPVQAVAKSATPVQSATSAAAKPERRPNLNVPKKQPERLVPEKATSPGYAPDVYGPVGANENLWSIASKVRPSSDVSVQQTMLAIQRLNPDAFIKDNINLLRKGQVLRVPDKEEIQALSSRQAVKEVASQNRAWSNRNKPSNSLTESSAQLEGSKSIAPTRTESTGVEGRIKLSSTADSKDDEAVGAGDGEKGTGLIESQLAVTQEELDATTRENSELKSRILSMEEQIQTMEKLVEVSSEEMRALELASKRVNEGVDESGTAAGGEEIEATASDAAQTSSDAAVQEDVQQPVVEDVKPTPQVVMPTPRKKSWLDLVQDNLIYIAGGLGVLVIGLATFFYFRGRSDDFDVDDYDDELDGIRHEFEAPDDELTDHSDAYVEEEQEYIPEIEEDIYEDEVYAEAETDDVVGECDIHIAYAQYDQAEEKLLRALESEPRNVAVRLKLLEVFAAQGDVEGFDSHYAKVRVLGDSEAIDRAKNMRGTMDGVEPFVESQYDTSSFLAKINEDYEATDTQIVGTNDYGSETPSAGDDLGFGGDDTLSFDLDEGDDSELESELEVDDTTRVPAFLTEKDEFDLDFDDGDGPDGNDLEDASLGDDLDDLEFDLKEDGLDVDFGLSNADDELGTAALSASKPGALDDNDLEDLDFDLEVDETTATRGLGEFDTDLGLGSDSVALAADDFEFDFDDLDSPEETSLSEQQDRQSEAMAFDLDKDLESAMTSDRDLSGVDDGLDELDLEDLGTFDIETEDDSEFDLLAEGDLELSLSDDELATNTHTVSALPKHQDDGLEELDDLESIGDFDVDYNLEDDINLDELDHELDELASELPGTDTAAIAHSKDSEALDSALLMDEPEVDFDSGDVISMAPQDKTKTTVQEPTTPNVAAAPSADDSLDFEIPDFDPENDDDSNLEFLSDNDETATKLDLARAYIDMGDADGAKDILDEIVEEGNDQQKKDAESLLARLG